MWSCPGDLSPEVPIQIKPGPHRQGSLQLRVLLQRGDIVDAAGCFSPRLANLGNRGRLVDVLDVGPGQVGLLLREHEGRANFLILGVLLLLESLLRRLR